MNLVRKSLTGLLAAVIGTAGLIVPAAAEEATFVQQITGQAYVGDAGTMVESFDIKVSDVSRYADLQAEDFDITGNYDGYPVNEQGEIVQDNYEDDGLEIAVSEEGIHLTFKPFRYPGGTVSAFAVTNAKFPELSFNADKVDSVSIRTVDEFEPGTFTASNGETLPYRLKLSASTGPQPLVVWLHGGGEVGTDNIKQLTENRGATTWTESGKDTSVLAVHYPKNYDWAIYSNAEQLKKMQDYFVLQYELIQKLVAEGKVDPDRIYLAGVSSGGGGAFRFMMQYPDLFAGAIVVAAKDAVADYKGPVDAFKQELKGLVDMPLWIVHAENDPITDSRTSKLAYQALTELGSTKVKETLYTDEFMDSQRFYGAMKHWSWAPVFNDQNMINWLFSQKRDSSETPSTETTSEEVVEQLAEQPAASGPITRSELAGLLTTELNLPVAASVYGLYEDVQGTERTQEIEAVTQAGLMRGIGQGQFAPDAAVTRAQLVVIVGQWLESNGVEGAESPGSTTGYSDVPEKHWAYQNAVIVSRFGIMPANGAGQLKPAQVVTVEEAAQVLKSLQQYKVK
ncbi:S-layer homology domain-containing protein [Paenibacillus massiliensis]|uniref:S-layer homology domain-containing protein n=1 Tax=Paenibacillus massiliensis TaxID=225917 RepID=UPI00037F3E87|nr:S-layer homology domain-containing protein [Paenibacillus massiliensis]